MFAPLLIAAFWIGITPKPFFTMIERSTAQIVERVQPGYYEQHHMVNPLKADSAPAAIDIPAR